MRATTLWRRQLARQPWLVLTAVAAVVVASGFVAIAPRILEHAAQQDLMEAIDTATPEQRNIRLELESRLGAGSTAVPFRYVRRQGDLRREELFPDLVDDLIIDQHFVYSSPSFEVRSYPERLRGPFPTTFRFRHQDGIDEQLRVVEGALPEVADPIYTLEGRDCPDGTEGSVVSQDYDLEALLEPLLDAISSEDESARQIDCRVQRVPVFETALSSQTATDMRLDVGDSFYLTPDSQDVKWHRFGGSDTRLLVTVSAVVDFSDPGLEYWYADTTLHRPRITENADFRLIGATGLIRPDRYRQMLRDVPGVHNDYTWRYLVGSDDIVADRAAELGTALAKIAPRDVELRTQLPELISDFVAQRALTVSLLSTVTASIIIAGVAAVLVVTMLLAARQRAGTALLVDRGASRRQAALAALLTVLVFILPAATLGWFAAWVAFPETSSVRSVQALAWLVGAMTVAIVIALAPWRFFVTPTHIANRGSRRARRIIVEVFFIVLGVGGIYLVRQRGLDATREPFERVDPLFALLPILVLMVLCVVLGRLIGPILRGVARLAERRRGLADFFVLRRVAGQKLDEQSPVFLVTVAIALAVLSSTVGLSIRTTQQDHARSIAGSDFRFESRIEGVPLPPSITDSPPVAGVVTAFATVHPSLQIVGETARTTATVAAVDVERFAEILNRTGRPSEVISRLGSVAAAPVQDDVLPALLSQTWPNDARLEMGDIARTVVNGQVVRFEVVGVSDDISAIAGPGAAVLIDLRGLEAVAGARIAQPSLAFVAAADEQHQALARLAAEEQSSVTFTSRQEVLDQIAGDPLSLWTNRMLTLAAAVAGLVVMIGVAAGVARSAAAQRRDLAILRTLGLTRAEASRMGAIEQLPGLIMAVAAGLLGGVGLALALEPALEFGAFADSSASGKLRLDALNVAALAGGLVLLATATLPIAQFIQHDRTDASALKIGDE